MPRLPPLTSATRELRLLAIAHHRESEHRPLRGWHLRDRRFTYFRRSAQGGLSRRRPRPNRSSNRSVAVDFTIPPEITAYLAELDEFIEREIKPLERENDNIRFFDHRREWARTDFERGGLPRHEWEELLAEMRRRADRAGHYRYALPKEYGGEGGWE